MNTLSIIATVPAALLLAGAAAAGPYSGAQSDPENPYDPAIPGFVDAQPNPLFAGWATGYLNYLPADEVWSGPWDDPEKALGPVTGDHFFGIVSLGDLDADEIAADKPPGEITLTFDEPIFNGPGADLAVFENGLMASADLVFGELGYVEVSTDNVHFARFPAVSLTPGPPLPYMPIDPTDIYNLAGKHANSNDSGGGEFEGSFGTPFNLDDLRDHSMVLDGLVDLNRIGYVKIVDIPGSGAFADSQENPIYDAWLTGGSGGLDLEAVGAVYLGLPADVNGDGAVDDDDLSLLLAHWGQAASWANGNLNGDETVDDNDLSLLLAHWTGPLAAEAAAIPEPGAIVLLILAAPLILRRMT